MFCMFYMVLKALWGSYRQERVDRVGDWRIFDRINREVISRGDAEAQRGFCGIIHTL
jgi:hypothetical protein